MIDSFLQTSRISSLSIALDNDDPCLDEYREIIKGRVHYTIDFRKTCTEIINSKWQFSADCFKYFSVTNDDFIFRTVDWDLKLVGTIKLHGGFGIAYGNDLLAGIQIPTMSVISREIVQELGWLQLPALSHLFGDNVWAEIGRKAECLHYRDDVIIEHMHVFGRKMEKDETFLRTNSAEMYRVDEAAFVEWLQNKSKSDIEKVKNLLCLPK